MHTVALGSRVAAGATVAELRDNCGHTAGSVVAPADGWLSIQPTFGQVPAGEPVAVLFTERGAETVAAGDG